MKYTVVGFWSDNNQPWVEHVEAEDGPAALLVALSGECVADSRVAVECFEGHLQGQGENEELVRRG